MTTMVSRLQACIGRSDLSSLLGFKPKAFAYVLFHVADAEKYTDFEIPKKNGGVRVISAPIPQLKLLQSRLSECLQTCLAEIEKADGVKESCAISHGFRKGRSIYSNAEVHKGRRWVFNIDLEDFFPSINFGRVRGYFIKNKNFALSPDVATVIAQIACHKNALPQGSPCSPVISNLLAHMLDMRISRIAKKARCSYTRYADDLTFSCSKKLFPDGIAQLSQADQGVWIPSDKLRHTIFSSGFKINKSKTRMQVYWSRQDATGLVVNAKVNVPREYVKTARAQCHQLITKGSVFNKEELWGQDVKVPYDPAKLQGKLSHIFNIKGQDLNFERQKGSLKTWPNFYRDYRSFLDYQSFGSSPKPVFLFEGKTDNIYIRCALNSLAADYPELISDGAPKQLMVRLFNYSRPTNAVQQLAGGTGDLQLLINNYELRLRGFSAATLAFPVILVVDNDKGSTDLFKAAGSKSDTKAKVDGSQPFYHITKNLYLVPTPTPKGMVESYIETFLPNSVLKKKLGKKTFHLPEKGFDVTKHFGKVLLAEQIVQRQQKAISFVGFKPLLDNMRAAMQDYAAKMAP
ncbi:retron Ec67 family RNA-directed DNA polymerase/endonuclease [Sulfitobacter aestuariivivens]|uniref:RNA-directed DNA polymerase n=1 Tax=Sulfitobacter aestuariivivens TaxID=2766981 RepID=A0A927D3U2_9RHOB|nr:retron Ec67 family RNA-directed DNA polymerase/endonuclease [Sulfitobacter aestuariivivens]MBD3663778.1 RNA-directed DNA polymerase [Sulfitobacter aestuariivivens]